MSQRDASDTRDRPAEDTKARLIASAMRHFGSHGYDATSLRSVVGDAGQNISSVKYHFGSKDGLFEACVRAAARRLKSEGPGRVVLSEESSARGLDRDAARAMIRVLIEAALRDAFRPELADEVRFLQREMVMNGRGADIFYEEVFRDHVAFFAEVIRIAEGIEDDTDARLRAMAIMFQTVFFVSARHVVETGVGWKLTTERIPTLVDALYPLDISDKVS